MWGRISKREIKEASLSALKEFFGPQTVWKTETRKITKKRFDGYNAYQTNKVELREYTGSIDYSNLDVAEYKHAPRFEVVTLEQDFRVPYKRRFSIITGGYEETRQDEGYAVGPTREVESYITEEDNATN